MNRFGPAFTGAGHLVLTDIYAAGEDPIAGVTIDGLAEEIRRSTAVPVDIALHLADVVDAVASIARPGDVVLTLGAGSIGNVASMLVERLENSTAAEHHGKAKA